MFTSDIFTDRANRFFVYREIPKNNKYIPFRAGGNTNYF